jgi:hypothetical protein
VEDGELSLVDPLTMLVEQIFAPVGRTGRG